MVRTSPEGIEPEGPPARGGGSDRPVRTSRSGTTQGLKTGSPHEPATGRGIGRAPRGRTRGKGHSVEPTWWPRGPPAGFGRLDNSGPLSILRPGYAADCDRAGWTALGAPRLPRERLS